MNEPSIGVSVGGVAPMTRLAETLGLFCLDVVLTLMEAST